MKISELNTKSFLGASGAAENSYVLINYEDETTNEPVTYKATVQELGKAIANKLQLTTNGQNGLATVKSSNGAWASEDKGQLVTAAEKTKIANAASTGAITAAVSGLASTGYVTNAVVDKTSIHSSDDNHGAPYLANGTGRAITVNMISGAASVGALENLTTSTYVTNAINAATNGLASTGYVDAAIENAGGGSEFNPSAAVVLEESGTNDNILTHPVFRDSATNTFYDASDSGYATPIFTMGRDRVVVFSSDDGIGYYDLDSSDFNKVEIDAVFDPKTYIDEDNSDQKLLFYKDSSGIPTIQVYDSNHSEYDTIALAPLQAGYANNTYDAAYIDENGHLIKVDTNDPATGAYATSFGVIASEGDITDAIRVGYTDNEYAHKTARFVLRDSTGNFYRINDSGWILDTPTLASQGYVTSAVSGLASTGYVTAHAGPSLGNIAAAVNNSGTILNGYVKAIASAKAALAVNGALNGLASTGYVTSAVNAINPRLGYTDTVANKSAEFVTKDGQGNFYYINSSGRLSDIGVLASQGYVTSHAGPSMGAIEAEVEDSNSTLYENICAVADGIVTDATNTVITNQQIVKFDIQSSYLKYYSSSNLLSDVTSRMISGAASTGYVDNAIGGLASTGYVDTAIQDLASTNYVANTIDDYATNQNLASTGYIDDAINGLASTTDITTALNAYIYASTNEVTQGATLLKANDENGGEFLDIGWLPATGSDTAFILGIGPSGEVQYPEYSVGDQAVYPETGPRILGYTISGNDLLLKDYKNNTICTLTGVINNA